jgi:hypothetical protein
MRPVQPPAWEQPQTGKERNLQRKLQRAAGKHRPGQHHHRRVEPVGKEQGPDDEGHVEQHRRDRRYGEAVPGVEHAGGEGHQRDEYDVREGDPQHRHRKVELGRVGRETGRRDVDHDGGDRDADQGRGHEGEKQQGCGAVDERPGVLGAHAVLVLGQDGDERLGEGPFREQAAQQVGQAKSDEKGVGRQSGAESARDDEVAREAEHAAHHRQAAHRGQDAQEVHSCGFMLESAPFPG